VQPSYRSGVTQLTMVCGGTGITPMLQVIRQIFKDESDTTRVSLLYGGGRCKLNTVIAVHVSLMGLPPNR
jgi:NAD(P)H-flavin reductase